MLLPIAAKRAIAVVEDDAAFRNALLYALEAQGYSVSLFDRAQDAIESRRILSADCLLIDYALPDIDGLAVLRALRGRRLTCPAIIIDSNLDACSRDQAQEAGAIVLEKPVFGEALNNALRRVLADPS
jgi:DNA-binding NtrC family response regulator